MSEWNKIQQILEAGPDSKPGVLEPKGPVQDLGGPVVTPATVKGPNAAKGISHATLPSGKGGNVGGAPNPTKFKDEADVKAKLGKSIDETEVDEDEVVEESSELPQWLKDRLLESSLEEDEVEEDEEVNEDEVDEDEVDEDEEVSEDEIDEDEEVAESDDDDEDDKEEKKDMKEAFKISKPNLTEEDVNALFKGAKLTESAKSKILTVFEAVVTREVNAQMEIIGECYNQQLAEEVDAMTNVLAEKVDAYLNDITESWVAENEVAIEQGIRTQLAESLLSEMKGVFERHYIDIPENKIDIVDTLAERVETLESELNESMKRTARLTEQVVRNNKEQAIRSVTQGMVALDAEKVSKLAEGLDYRNQEEFTEKVEIIKEHYTGSKSTKPAKSSVTLNEENGPVYDKITNNIVEDAVKASAAYFKNR